MLAAPAGRFLSTCAKRLLHPTTCSPVAPCSACLRCWPRTTTRSYLQRSAHWRRWRARPTAAAAGRALQRSTRACPRCASCGAAQSRRDAAAAATSHAVPLQLPGFRSGPHDDAALPRVARASLTHRAPPRRRASTCWPAQPTARPSAQRCAPRLRLLHTCARLAGSSCSSRPAALRLRPWPPLPPSPSPSHPRRRPGRRPGRPHLRP